MRKIISLLALTLIAFGIFAFIFNAALIFGTPFNRELPLYGVQGVVEQNDKIYVGLGVYSRVQIYDLNGKYIGYKNTENNSKDFDFGIDSNGDPRIMVTPIGINVDFSSVFEYAKYKIERIIPFRMICYVQNKPVVIEQPFFMALWAGPFSPLFSVMLGVFVFAFTNIERISQYYINRSEKR